MPWDDAEPVDYEPFDEPIIKSISQHQINSRLGDFSPYGKIDYSKDFFRKSQMSGLPITHSKNFSVRNETRFKNPQT